MHEHCRYAEPDELKEVLAAALASEEKLDGLVDVPDKFGNYALHKAAGNGNVECCQMLIDAGVKYQANREGATPLHWAILNKHLGVVKLLLSAFSANIDVLDTSKYKKSVMSCAFEIDNNEILKVVLEHKSAAPLDEMDGGRTDASGNTSFKSGDMTEERVPDNKEASQALGDGGETRASLTHSFDLPKGSTGAESEGDIQQKRHVIRVRELGDVMDKSLHTDVASSADGGEDLLGIHSGGETDVTGLYIWAASVILAKWVIKHTPMFCNARVLELGAGCGLPALAVATHTEAVEIVATDYRKDIVDNIAFNIEANGLESRVSIRLLDWDENKTAYPDDFAGRFDVLVGSDLVYHEGIVPNLLRTIDTLLKQGGTFVFVHKEQRHSVKGFVALVRTLFKEVHTELVPERSGQVSSSAESHTVEGQEQPIMSAQDDYYFANPLRDVSEDVMQLYFPELNNTQQFYVHTFASKK